MSSRPSVPAQSAGSGRASEQTAGGGKGARAAPLRARGHLGGHKGEKRDCTAGTRAGRRPARGECSPARWPVVFRQAFLRAWSCRTAALPCPPVSLQRAPSRSNQDCNCSRACLALAQLRLSGFPFWTEIVWCLSPTFTPSAQTSAARRGPGRCQPLLCQNLSPGPPLSPTANWGCFRALLRGSELLMGEEMPLGVLGPLRQPHQGCCWRQE